MLAPTMAISFSPYRGGAIFAFTNKSIEDSILFSV